MKKATLFLLILGIFLGGISLFKKDFFIYKEINLKDILLENNDDPQWVNTLSPLIDYKGKLNSQGVIKGNISSQHPGKVEFLFKEKVSFDGFSFFFFGNLHSVSSALAKDFSIYVLNNNNEWELLKEVKNNNLPFYQFSSKNKIITRGLKIEFISAYYENSVWFKNFKFLEKRKVNLIDKIKYFILENNQTLPFYWFYYFVYFLFLFIPGTSLFSILEKIDKGKIDNEVKFVFSPLVSIFLMFVCTVFYLFLGNKTFLNLYLIIFIISFLYFLKMKSYEVFFHAKTALIFFILPLLINFLTISHRDYLFNMQYIGKEIDSLHPIPTEEVYIGYFADNLFPWRLARAYLHRMPLFSEATKKFLINTNFFDRTPLLPLITVNILNIFGERHFVYQRFLETLAVLIYPAFYLLIKKYFSYNVAVITILCLILNIQISFMPFNVEYFYKYFAIYPLILALILILSNYKQTLIIGSLIMISFLIHPYTLFIDGGILSVYLFKIKKQKMSFILKKTIFLLGPLLIFFVIWLSLPKILIRLGYLNNDLLYLNLYKERFIGFNWKLMRNKIIGLVYLIIPNILLKGVQTEKISIFSREFLFEFFRYSLISNLSPLFFIFLFKYLLKEKLRKNLEFIILAFFPLLFYWLFFINAYNQAFNYGGYYFHFFTFTTPILFSYCVFRILREKKLKKFIVFSSYILFMAFNLYYISGNFKTMKCASIIVNTLSWLIIIVYCLISFGLLKIILKES